MDDAASEPGLSQAINYAWTEKFGAMRVTSGLNNKKRVDLIWENFEVLRVSLEKIGREKGL